jgi:hypothetical protein
VKEPIMAKPPRTDWACTERAKPAVTPNRPHGKRPWAPVPSATFRFAQPTAFALIHRRAAQWQWRALAAAIDSAANNDLPQNARIKNGAHARFKQVQLAGARRAGAQRTADKRPPDLGEMERLHDIHGGIFADRTDQGRS